jgi:deazaflavin-dependent oxidoreductase (nitroreductase family)
VVVASNAGQDHAPDWFRNVLADPDVTVDGRPMTATIVPADEAADLWPRLDALFGGYRKYRARTERVIPLVRLRSRSER